MYKNLQEIIMNPMVSRAAYVQRYSSSRLCDPENLATHVYEVQMIGLMIINELKKCSVEVDEHEFLMKSLLHDVDETVLGDTPRPLKYASPEIHDSIEEVADNTARNLMYSYFEGDTADRYYGYYKQSKKDLTGFIVKMADMLSVLKKVVFEVEYLHNLTMLKVVDNLVDYTESLRDSLSALCLCKDDEGKYILSGRCPYILNNILVSSMEYIISLKDKYSDIERV